MKPLDPAVSTDLAVLDALRSEVTGDPNPALKALGLLEETLRRSPEYSTARFNRALILIRLNRIPEAAEDLRKCMSQERDPEWAKECGELLRKLP